MAKKSPSVTGKEVLRIYIIRRLTNVFSSSSKNGIARELPNMSANHLHSETAHAYKIAEGAIKSRCKSMAEINCVFESRRIPGADTFTNFFFHTEPVQHRWDILCELAPHRGRCRVSSVDVAA